MRNDRGCLRLARDRSKFHFNSLNFISLNSLLKVGSNHMRTNISSLKKSMIFMIQQSLSVKLPYKNIKQRSPGNDVAAARPKV